jgi:hypothetical protein
MATVRGLFAALLVGFVVLKWYLSSAGAACPLALASPGWRGPKKVYFIYRPNFWGVV